MKPLRLILFICLSLLFSQNLLYGQNKTYALVIGVSKYKHPGIDDLKYADDDALAFVQMLKSPAVGVDSSNIHLYLNENATISNIQCSYQWLEGVTKRGDNVILFFSGHGDAIDPHLVYLLPHGADGSDPNNYEQTALGIYRIKIFLKKLASKGIQTFLFLDACRSNEFQITDSLASSIEGVLTRCEHEVQFTSTSANDYSYEDLRWGNGHGVFSYYLIMGWLGDADKDEDGLITVYELTNYVRDNVFRDTRDIVSKKTMQRPVLCANNKDDIVIGKVDSQMLGKLRLAKQQNVVVDNIFSYVTSKHQNFTFNLSSNNQSYLDSVLACIHMGRFITPKNRNAEYYYQLLRNAISKDSNLIAGIKAKLLSVLLEDGQKLIELYLNDDPYCYSSLIIKRAVDETALALKILGENDAILDFLKERNLFFQSQLYYSKGDFIRSKILIDSAIVISDSSSYLYYTRGLLFRKMNNIEKCLMDFDVAISFSPNWGAPYIAKAYTLLLLGRRNEASQTIVSMTSKAARAYNYCLAGDFYFSIDQYNVARENYRKALQLDKKYDRAAIGLSVCDQFGGIQSNSLMIHADDSLYFLSKYAKYYEKTFDFEMAANTYLNLYRLDTSNLKNYIKYAECSLNQGKENIPVAVYKEIIRNDKNYLDAYKKLADFYEKRGYYDSAIIYHRRLYIMDKSYNPANLYESFKKNNQIDSALFYLNKAFLNKDFSQGINLTKTANIQVLEFLRLKKNIEALKLADSIKVNGLADCETYNLSSIVYDEFGKGKQAIEDITSAIMCDPTNDLYYVNLAIYYKRYMNNSDSVINTVLKPYIRFKCNSKPYLKYTIYLLSGTKDLGNFKFILDVAIKHYPDDPEFLFYNAIYYHVAGSRSRFYQYFEQAIDNGLTKESYQKESYRFDEFLHDDLTFQNLKARIKN